MSRPVRQSKTDKYIETVLYKCIYLGTAGVRLSSTYPSQGAIPKQGESWQRHNRNVKMRCLSRDERGKHIPQRLHKTAVTKVRDSEFAKNLLQSLGDSHVRLRDAEVHMSKMQLGGETEFGMNRLQLARVACSWFNHSNVAPK